METILAGAHYEAELRKLHTHNLVVCSPPLNMSSMYTSFMETCLTTTMYGKVLVYK